jgi:hypothetical protein
MYVNVTLRGASDADADAALRSVGRSAFMLSTPEGIVVFDQTSGIQDGSVDTLAQHLSTRCGCVALAVTNHDDDVFMYRLFDKGTEIDAYNSAPGYWTWDGEGDEPGPEGGQPALLAGAFGRVENSTDVQAALSEDYDFEVDRHAAICRAAGLPIQAVGYGFDDFASGKTGTMDFGGSRVTQIRPTT